MRCFIKVLHADESLAFKGTITLDPGQTHMSQTTVNGEMATVEIMARREGDVPDILDELDQLAAVVEAPKPFLDTLRRMRREFNEILIQGEVKNPEVELLKLQLEDWRVGHTNLKRGLELTKDCLEQIYQIADKALKVPTPPTLALEEIMRVTGYTPPQGDPHG